MAKIFYLSEVINFAISKEKESFSLYQDLSNKTNNEDERNLFHQLMQEEKQHEAFYTDLLTAIPKEQTTGVKENEEYDAYMQELISASKSVAVLDLEKNPDIKKIIVYAIAREKDSILFYVGLKNYLPPNNSDKIDIIIRKEAQHMAKLYLLKHSL